MVWSLRVAAGVWATGARKEAVRLGHSRKGSILPHRCGLLLLVVFFSCVAVAFAYMHGYNGVNHGMRSSTDLAFLYDALTDPPGNQWSTAEAAITLTTGPGTDSATW